MQEGKADNINNMRGRCRGGRGQGGKGAGAGGRCRGRKIGKEDRYVAKMEGR